MINGHYTVAKLATACDVTRRTVYNWIRAGRIAAFRFPPGSRNLRIAKAEGDRLIAESQGEQSPTRKENDNGRIRF